MSSGSAERGGTAGPDWWEGLADLDLPGPPGAESHRLVWSRGRFVLPSHPDPEAEAAIIALGGDRCPCLDILDAWQDQHVEPAIFSVGAHYANESPTLDAKVAAFRRAEVRRWQAHLTKLRTAGRRRADLTVTARLATGAGPAERTAAQRLGLFQLLSLPPVLQLRLQSSVAAGLAAAGRLDRLAVPTAKRAEPFLRELGWVGRVNDVELVASATQASVDAEAVALPAGWLAQVWGRGLGTVDGALVVGVDSVGDGGRRLEVVAVEPEGHAVALEVERWENGWRPT